MSEPSNLQKGTALIEQAERELADESRPIDKYDLSALYLQIGLSWLVPHDEKIEALGRVAIQDNYRLNRVCHILFENLVQLKGQLLNLEKRVYALENKKSTRKDKL